MIAATLPGCAASFSCRSYPNPGQGPAQTVAAVPHLTATWASTTFSSSLRVVRVILPWPTPGHAIGTGPRSKMAAPGCHRPQSATRPDRDNLRTAASTADLAVSHSYSIGLYGWVCRAHGV